MKKTFSKILNTALVVALVAAVVTWPSFVGAPKLHEFFRLLAGIFITLQWIELRLKIDKLEAAA